MKIEKRHSPQSRKERKGRQEEKQLIYYVSFFPEFMLSSAKGLFSAISALRFVLSGLRGNAESHRKIALRV